MLFQRTILLALLLLLLLTGIAASGQKRDSSYIQTFDKKNDFEVYTNWTSTRFSFLPLHGRKSDFSLLTNSSVHTGFNLNYKWASIGYGVSVPATARDEAAKKMQQYAFQLGSNSAKMGWTAYVQWYKNFLTPQTHRSYVKISSVHYTGIGSSFYFITNSKKFSYSAAKSYSQLQRKSCGTFLLSLSPTYNAFTHKGDGFDNEAASVMKESDFLLKDPRWLSLIGGVAYMHNIVWQDGRWNVSPLIHIGYGRLHEFSSSKWQPATEWKSSLTVGYNSQTWYSYLSCFYHAENSYLKEKKIAEQNNGISLTAGYRLGNLKNKIAGIL
ncbi:MAG: DUF4421 family protein [Flavisolibacter sp.]|nr:DUF4421 family protein [Flavisolibacter sp.]